MSFAQKMAGKAQRASADRSDEIVAKIVADIEKASTQGKMEIIYEAEALKRIFPTTWYFYDKNKWKGILGSSWDNCKVTKELKDMGFVVTDDHPRSGDMSYQEETLLDAMDELGGYDWYMTRLEVDWSKEQTRKTRGYNAQKGEKTAADKAREVAKWATFASKDQVLQKLLNEIEKHADEGHKSLKLNKHDLRKIFPPDWYVSSSGQQLDTVMGSSWDSSGIRKELEDLGLKVETDSPYEQWDGDGPVPLFVQALEELGGDWLMTKLEIDWSKPTKGSQKGSGHAYFKKPQGGAMSESNESASMFSAGEGPKCFVRDTLLQKSTGEYVAVQDVIVGDLVQGEGATPTKVIARTVHNEQWQILVELRFETGFFVFTGSHRVVVEISGKRREQLAADLEQGDKVLCETGPQELLEIRRRSERVSPIELAFRPNILVLCFESPREGMYSKGQRPSRQHRRGGMNQRQGASRSSENYSHPDTEGDYSD